MAQVDLSEVATAQKTANDELFLEVEQNNVFLQVLDPGLAVLQVIHVEVDRLFFRHQDEAVHILLRRVFEIVFLEAAIFYV